MARITSACDFPFFVKRIMERKIEMMIPIKCSIMWYGLF
jgi:hypothetical protein